MKKIYLLSIIAALILFSANAPAEIIKHERGKNTYIDQATVAELEEFFGKNHYRRFNVLPDNAYPRIYVKKLPTDYKDIQSQKYRNELFVRILAPIALKINEELSNERHTILRLERKYMRNKTLSPEDIALLESLAQKYDYFVRNKDESRIHKLLQGLKLRVNIIPPSILIATAAMETNWGSSRIAQEANSLYKEKVWYTDEGIEPLENKDDGYRFKIFPNLTASMRSFAIKFNSDQKFLPAWQARDIAAKRYERPLGESLAYTLSQISNLPNFIGILDYTSTFYNFYSIDIGHLK